MSSLELIDCNADAPCQIGYTVVEHHRRVEPVCLTADDSRLFVHWRQRFDILGLRVGGERLRSSLKGMPVMPANVLNFLLANPERLPISWGRVLATFGGKIYFWGTIYSQPLRGACVPFLEACNAQLYGGMASLEGCVWGSDQPAALFIE